MQKGKNGSSRVAALVCSVALFATLLPVQVLAADEGMQETLTAVTLLEENGEETVSEQGDADNQQDEAVACTKSEDCAAETHEEGCPKYVVPEGEGGETQIPEPEESQNDILEVLPATDNEATAGDAPDVGKENLPDPANGVQPLGDTQTTGAAMATYVSADGAVKSESDVTLEAAVDALNNAGGGTVTVTQSGTVSKTMEIKSNIAIVADKPVTVSFPTVGSIDYSMFYIETSHSLTLGQDGLQEEMLAFDLSGAEPQIRYGALVDGEADVTLCIEDGTLITGARTCVVWLPYYSNLHVDQPNTVKMNGGIIRNNNLSEEYQSIITTNYFIMTGGKIVNNTTTEGCVDVSVSFEINGIAEIAENVCGDAPVICDTNSANISRLGGNAVIRDCKGGQAGALHVGTSKGYQQIMEGEAQILRCTQTKVEEYENKLASYSGAIYFYTADGIFTMQDSALISSCSGCVGAVGIECNVWGRLYENLGPITFTMKDNAKITQNSGVFGGGVGFNLYTNATIEGNAEISHNSASKAGGGIFLVSLSKPGSTPITSLFVQGGSIKENSAPLGGGVCVASYRKLCDLLGIQYSGESAEPAVLELNSGATITGNTAAEQGGGIWVSWENSPKLSGVINVTGNTLENDTVNDIYLDRDPDAPEDPVVPEWPEGSEEPGNEPSVEEFLEFVHTLATQTAKDVLEATSDSDVVQSAQGVGYLPEEITADDLSPEEMASLRDWLEEQLIIVQSYNLFSVNIIAQYKNTYGAQPSLDVFKQTVKVVYEDYVVFDTKAFSIGWTFDPSNEKVVMAASQLGLSVENGRYTGTEE